MMCLEVPPLGGLSSTTLPEGGTPNLLNSTCSSTQEIDQHKLGKVGRVGEVSLAIRHCGHLLNELDEVIVASQHEGIDHDASLATSLNFGKSRIHYPRIAAH